MKIGLTGRIARSSAEHPWRTVSAWIVILAAAVWLAGSVNDNLTLESKNLVTTESDTAFSLAEQYRPDPNGDVYVEAAVVSSDQFAFGDPEFTAAVGDTVAALSALDGVYEIQAPAAGSPTVSQSGHAALVTYVTERDDAVSSAALDALAALDSESVRVLPSGPGTFNVAFNQLAADELGKSEGFGIIVALIILIVVFGALAAAGLPIGVGIVSIVTTLGIISALGRLFEMYDAAVTLAGMLGLALGIDYSLVAIQRFREELAKGHTVLDAVTITGSTANRAILLSGATVVVSLAGLMFIPTNALYAISIGAGFVAIVSVCSALTLLPAVLRLLGHRVNKGRVPTAHPGTVSPRWVRLAKRVTARPALSATAGILVLLVLATPLLSIRLATNGPDGLPADFVVRESNQVLVNEFGYGQASTFVVVEDASANRAGVDALAAAVEADPGFEGTTVDWRGDVAFVDTHDAFASDDTRSKESIDRLRGELIPAALGEDARAYVAGDNVKVFDEVGLFATHSWKVVLAVLGVSFLILLVVFRSIVIPLKAIALNLLGVGAAFGTLVAAFQFGWGRFLGLPEVSSISPYMPIFIFALVFGLSMDYHVFLLSRIKEGYDTTRDNEKSIVDGLSRTGPLITGAAVIMVAVFGGFAAAGIPEMAQWGFGLAAGVLIDATVIRILLVPAAMAWLGTSNWYLPSWLQWLPKTSLEAVAPAPANERGELEPALV